MSKKWRKQSEDFGMFIYTSKEPYFDADFKNTCYKIWNFTQREKLAKNHSRTSKKAFLNDVVKFKAQYLIEKLSKWDETFHNGSSYVYELTKCKNLFCKCNITWWRHQTFPKFHTSLKMLTYAIFKIFCQKWNIS